MAKTSAGRCGDEILKITGKTWFRLAQPRETWRKTGRRLILSSVWHGAANDDDDDKYLGIHQTTGKKMYRI